MRTAASNLTKFNVTEQSLPPTVSDSELGIVIRLLRKNSSLTATSAYLKNKELHSSAGSWEVMRDERLRPALDAGDLDRQDLLRLLQDAEEYGRQHVFLYKTDPQTVASLLNPVSLRAKLMKMGIKDLYDKERIVETVPGLQLVGMRHEEDGKGTAFVAKFLNVRRYMEQEGKPEINGKHRIIHQVEREDRAVDTFRVRTDGLTEVRVQSHRNAINYTEEAEEVFAKLTGIVDRMKFPDFSLSKTRRFLLENGPKLTKEYAFGAGVAKTKKGGSVSLGAHVFGQGMFEGGDDEMEGALETLKQKAGGRLNCDNANCTVKKQPTGPSVDIHIYVGGKNNEMNIIPHCSKADYRHVLTKIVTYAK